MNRPNHDHFAAGFLPDIFDRFAAFAGLAAAKFRDHHCYWMVEEPIALHRAAQAPDLSPAACPQTVFDRPELNRILNLYGRMVAAGEWRDYALDFLEDVAVFSIFRRASEMPLFRIEKRPSLRAKQGMYSVIAHGGIILKRGHELAQVLKVFDKKLLKALAKES